MYTKLEEEIIHYWKNKNLKAKEITELTNLKKHVIYKFISDNEIKRNYENKEWLIQKHFIELNNLEEISKLANCSRDTIERSFKSFGLQQDNKIRYSSKKMKTYQILNENIFETIDTEEKAYWLGFIVADGSIQKMKCNTYRLAILLARKDRNHLEKFKEFLLTEQPIKDSSTTLNGKIHLNTCIRINSTKMCNDLMNKKVFPKKSTKEIFPKDKIPEFLYRHFIRGYFDGDGCFSYYFNKKRNCIVGSLNFIGSYDLLSEIQLDFKNISEIKAKIRENGSIFTFTISKDLEKLMEYMYKDSSVYLERKRKKYNDYLSLKKI